jgi:hypothetical protein
MASNLLGLSREQLSKFLPDHQSIRKFEQLMLEVGENIPTSVEQANNNANTAIAMAGAALAALSEAINALEQVVAQPVPQAPLDQEDYVPLKEVSFDPEDYAPVVYVGTLGLQNADEVEITGGSISGVTLSATSGAFSTISVTGQITSTLATGTPPFVIASTTKVNNLNADLLDGTDWTAPGTIGGVTPGSATFTSITATSTVTLSPANANVTASPTGTGTVTISPAVAGNMDNMAIGATTARSGRMTNLRLTDTAGGASTKSLFFDVSNNYALGIGPTSTEGYVEYHSGTANTAVFGHRFNVNGTERFRIDGTGLAKVTGSLQSTTGFGCNGTTPQTAVASGGAVVTTAATNVSPFGYTTAAQADRIVALLNTIRTALVNNGIMT